MTLEKELYDKDKINNLESMKQWIIFSVVGFVQKRKIVLKNVNNLEVDKINDIILNALTIDFWDMEDSLQAKNAYNYKRKRIAVIIRKDIIILFRDDILRREQVLNYYKDYAAVLRNETDNVVGRSY